MNIPVYITLSFGLLVVVLLAAFVYAVQYGLKKTELDASQRSKKLWSIMLPLFAWLTVSGGLSYAGFFANFSTIPPRFPLGILVPMVGIVLFMRSKTGKLIIANLPAQWLVYMQVFRIPMELILWALFIENIIPIQMTFEGANFDVLTAIFALPVGYLCFTRKTLSVKWAIAWNIVGLLLVTTIVIIAILSAPTPFRFFHNNPANTFIAYLPYIWLPGFVVPMAYLMHFVSLRQLLGKTSATNDYKLGVVGL